MAQVPTPPRGMFLMGNEQSRLAEGRNYYAAAVSRASTAMREYMAVQSVGFCPLSRILLTPSEFQNVPTRSRTPEEIAMRLRGYVNVAHYNPKQLEAMYSGLSRSQNIEIQLLQGPPGTGKTHMLIGLLTSLVNSLRRRRVEEMAAHGRRCPRSSSRSRSMPMVEGILVCAPSNAAIDEIVERLAASPHAIGVRIVRVGDTESSSPAVSKVYTRL